MKKHKISWPDNSFAEHFYVYMKQDYGVVPQNAVVGAIFFGRTLGMGRKQFLRQTVFFGAVHYIRAM